MLVQINHKLIDKHEIYVEILSSYLQMNVDANS